ncbi:MAG: hypothetical protein KAS75_08255 [Planctomycetes bacterium]|nr:hypothetical protein [Planctomycetota bacterium]
MNTPRIIIVCCLLVLSSLVLSGCGKKADENKPVSEVKAEAETMDVEKLKSMAIVYKDAITAKKGDIEKVMAQLKEVPITKMMGEEAKSLKADIDSLSKSISAFKERYQIYYNKLKEKGGDVSGLKI